MTEKTEDVHALMGALKKSIDTAENALSAAQKWIDKIEGKDFSDEALKRAKQPNDAAEQSVFYGVFNGKQMETETGKVFPVPANYASKSKLIEGDSLKMTLLPSGEMIYKHIDVAERELMQGTLVLDKDAYKVLCNDRLIQVPYASITFFRAQVGDSIVVIAPKDESKTWGAIESVV